MVSHWGIAWRMASRFVAGRTAQDAIRVVQGLNQQGIQGTLDHLGENVISVEAAQQATNDIVSVLESIQSTGIRSNVSVKLSQLGLGLDEELCRRLLRQILDKARSLDNFIRIDMEDSSVTEKTIQIYLGFQNEGFGNVGLVVQSYLYRSHEDVTRLSAIQARIRLVKGAYLESTHVAYPRKADVDANFDRLVKLLYRNAFAAGLPRLSADGRTPPIPAIATHDIRRIEYAKALQKELDLPKDALEFQMLYGIRRDLQEKLVREGYPVRVYVPYGEFWYPYYMRRLAERPANLWFFIRNLFW